MLHKKKTLFILIGVIVVIIGAVLTNYFIQKRPQNVIESRLQIELPSDSKIVKYNYINYGRFFDAKILIKSESIDPLKRQLNKFFGGPHMGEISDTYNFENTCEWWDLNKNNVDTYYFIIIDRKKRLLYYIPRSRPVSAFITNEENGEHYLYISY